MDELARRITVALLGEADAELATDHLANAILSVIQETHVIVERGRWERVVLRARMAARNPEIADDILQEGDL